MKFLHLADLHFGKTINGINLIESGDQPYWVTEFVKLTEKLSPDAVVISGDVYDRSAPNEKAVELLDRMLTEITDRNIPVLMIAGNHDSGQRLSFGHSLLAKQNVYISGVLKKELPHVTISGVTFWLMPYIFPMAVAELLKDESIRDYDTAVRRLLAEQEIDFTRPNVLVAHQNVVADGQEVERGGSESMVGGVGEIEYTAFDGFDYVALGHIHSSYPVGRETVRYAGTPMCYHFNETKQPEKGPLLVEIPTEDGTPMGDGTPVVHGTPAEDGTPAENGTPAGKKSPVITRFIIPQLHTMREIKDTWDNVVKDAENCPYKNEYLRIVITDKKVDPAVMDHLRAMYAKRDSIIMESASEYSAFSDTISHQIAHTEQKPMEELFAEFYSSRNLGAGPDDCDADLLHFIGELVRNTSDTDLAAHPEIPGEQDLEKVLKFMKEQEN